MQTIYVYEGAIYCFLSQFFVLEGKNACFCSYWGDFKDKCCLLSYLNNMWVERIFRLSWFHNIQHLYLINRFQLQWGYLSENIKRNFCFKLNLRFKKESVSVITLELQKAFSYLTTLRYCSKIDPQGTILS